MEHYQYTHHHAQALWLMTGPDWPTQLLRLQCGGVACKFTQDRMFYERALFAHQHPSLRMPPLPHGPVLASFLSMISEVVSEIQVIRLSGHPSPSRINENTRAGCYPDPTRYPHNGTARAKQHRRRRRQHIVAKARRRTGVSVQAANGESVTDLASSSHSARYLSAIHNQIGTTLHGHASWPPTRAALSLHQHPHPSCDITMCRSAGILLSSCNGRNTVSPDAPEHAMHVDDLCPQHNLYMLAFAPDTWLMQSPEWLSRVMSLQCRGPEYCQFRLERLCLERARLRHQLGDSLSSTLPLPEGMPPPCGTPAR
jgi:hypothetical protein